MSSWRTSNRRAALLRVRSGPPKETAENGPLRISQRPRSSAVPFASSPVPPMLCCCGLTRGNELMNATSTKSPDRLIANLAGVLPALETAYKDIHAHPELSMQEHRTAGIAAKHLRNNG